VREREKKTERERGKEQGSVCMCREFSGACMWHDLVHLHVCVCVCVSVCESVCMCV